MIIDSNIKITLYMATDISIDDIVHQIAYTDEQEERYRLLKEYEKCRRFMHLGQEQISDGLKD